MVGKVYDPALAVLAGAGAGGIVYAAVPELPVWGSAALLWVVGVALALHGYRLAPDWNVSGADERSPVTITTQRGWTLMALSLTCGLAAFCVVFARWVLTLPPSVEVWFIVAMAAMGPAVAGLLSWWGSESEGGSIDSPDVAASS